MAVSEQLQNLRNTVHDLDKRTALIEHDYENIHEQLKEISKSLKVMHDAMMLQTGAIDMSKRFRRGVYLLLMLLATMDLGIHDYIFKLIFRS